MLKYDLIYHMPSFRSAWDDVDHSLNQGQAVVIRTDSIRQRHLISDYIRSIPLESGSLDLLDVSDIAGTDPLRALFQVYTANWLNPRVTTLSDLFSSNILPTRILLSGFEKLPSNEVHLWGALLNEWAHLVANNEVAPELLVITESLPELEKTVARLGAWTTSDWSGLPSALEVQLVLRLSQDKDTNVARSRWREHLLPSLCRRDWELMDYLWDTVLEERGRLFAALRDYAVKFPAALDYNSASVLILEDEDSVDMMLWHGQMQCVYPLLNEARYKMSKSISDRLGTNRWPELVKWDPDSNNNLYDKDATADFGQIKDILLKKANLKILKDQFMEVTEIGRGLRNDLAHYCPISFREFEKWLIKAKEYDVL